MGLHQDILNTCFYERVSTNDPHLNSLTCLLFYLLINNPELFLNYQFPFILQTWFSSLLHSFIPLNSFFPLHPYCILPVSTISMLLTCFSFPLHYYDNLWTNSSPHHSPVYKCSILTGSTPFTLFKLLFFWILLSIPLNQSFPLPLFLSSPPYSILTEPSHPVTHHHIHVPHEAPESSGLILGHIQDGGKEVAHALNIAKVEVVHHIGHEDVMQQGDIGVVLSLEEWVVAVCAVDILLCL